jgi:hypothetical protein
MKIIEEKSLHEEHNFDKANYEVNLQSGCSLLFGQ